MTTPTVRVADRLVLTLSIEGQDVALLTAYDWDGGLFLESLVTYPKAPATVLLALIEAGIAEANRRQAKHVGIFQPAKGIDPRLRTVAKAFGFRPYHQAEDGVYLVLRQEAA